ncbi:MAG: hypothetical protein ACQEVA_09165 [Myxococcota bacterium]
MCARTTAAALVITAVVLAAGCTKTVTLKKSAYDVEVASASAVAASRLECRELQMLDVTTHPKEEPENARWTVAEIKARNLGASMDATHLVWQDKETFLCDRDGNRLTPDTDEAKNARECKRLSAMSYQCMVGSAPPM